MSVPPFALPAPKPPDPPAARLAGAPDAVSGARAVAATGALGAAALAATLAASAGLALFEQDVVEVVARPAAISGDVSVQALRDLAGLPSPSPLVAAALVPAVALLLLAGLLRRLAADAPPRPGVTPEALAAAEATMRWSVRVIAAGAVAVFVVPALLQLVGLRTVSLTTGSMAPAYPAGSLVLAVAPADRAAIAPGTVVVIGGPDGSHLTHRVAAAVRDPSGAVVAYRTRGDAVGALDPVPAAPDAIEGVVVAGLPVLGSLRAWMASPLGIALGVVLAWSFAGVGALLGDDRRRALRSRSPAQPAARSRIAPTS